MSLFVDVKYGLVKAMQDIRVTDSRTFPIFHLASLAEEFWNQKFWKPHYGTLGSHWNLEQKVTSYKQKESKLRVETEFCLIS